MRKSEQINRLNFPFDPAPRPSYSVWPALRVYGRIPGVLLPINHSRISTGLGHLSLDVCMCRNMSCNTLYFVICVRIAALLHSFHL